MKTILKNNRLTVEIDSLGAELHSIKKNTGEEYLWNGNPEIWGYHAPVLFPLVGAVNGGSYQYQGISYQLEQHGFARVKEFILVKSTETMALYRLLSDKSTLAFFPFSFVLDIKYELKNVDLTVTWVVKNPSKDILPFNIGGHPAFLCPFIPDTEQTDYFIKFDADKLISTTFINGKAGTSHISLSDGILPVTGEMFEEGAIILEKHQVTKVQLLAPDKTPYLTVSFNSPLLGIWSPANKKAPFLCIEPWYGRRDAIDCPDTWESRKWTNHLKGGENFSAAYTITL